MYQRKTERHQVFQLLLHFRGKWAELAERCIGSGIKPASDDCSRCQEKGDAQRIHI
jgi:hypothetical protein